MTGTLDTVWSDHTSVLLTSFYGWGPETWGAIGWSGKRGFTRRENLLKQLTDPFITVCYITKNYPGSDPYIKGKVVGFYVASHERGDRDDFLHPVHRDLQPEKWRHSLRALRAFSYLPEHRLDAYAFDPSLRKRAQSVGSMGVVLDDSSKINLLRDTPSVEVEVYQGNHVASSTRLAKNQGSKGMVRGGPGSFEDYSVGACGREVLRHLYVLRMAGDIDAYLGYPSEGRAIYKIGLSKSPEMRRMVFEKAMPRGAFSWKTDRTSRQSINSNGWTFEAAKFGEDTMKNVLARKAEWLGGEFYLAKPEQINDAWHQAINSANTHEKSGVTT